MKKGEFVMKKSIDEKLNETPEQSSTPVQSEIPVQGGSPAQGGEEKRCPVDKVRPARSRQVQRIGQELRENRVEYLRKKVGYSRCRLADRLGVDLRTVQRWEEEKNNVLSERTIHLDALANVFHVEPYYFTDSRQALEDLPLQFRKALRALETHRRNLRQIREIEKELVSHAAEMTKCLWELEKLQAKVEAFEADHLDF